MQVKGSGRRVEDSGVRVSGSSLIFWFQRGNDYELKGKDLVVLGF